MVKQWVAVALVGWCCAASSADPSRSAPNVSQERLVVGEAMIANPADEAARTKMHQFIDLKLNDTRISDAIDMLRGLTGADLFVNWKALEAAGIRRDEPISLRVRKVHASTALDLILRIASPEGPRLGWRVDNGVVTISTADELAKNVMIRVYDVRDLLAKITPGDDRANKVRTILKLVTDRVDPGSWREHGGVTASVREMQGQLIVTQTAENHRAIIDLLQSIRPLFATASR